METAVGLVIALLIVVVIVLRGPDSDGRFWWR